MRYVLATLSLVAGVSLCAAPAEQPAGAIATTHVIVLKNGASIRCNVLSQDDARVVAAVGSLGTFTLARAQLSAVRVEEGSIARRPAAAQAPEPPAPPAPELVPPAQAHEQPSEPFPDLVPPPVPDDLRDEIQRWLYHLGRTRGKNRIQAERNLKALGPAVVGPVLPFTQRPESLIRCAALRIIADTRHPSGVAALWNALADDDEVVRQVAYENLVKVTGLDLRFNPRGTLRARDSWREEWRDALAKARLLP